eukprot:gnl/TRDRNA2_/TRDRNA2_166693_c0_seq2.p1 gnl/TRDRNA2_/TRDRNA2_166693_c0~~gnl/TRDRNA2_/TRDRNA2_166693_c0_seq2.p1  ORF type:complete len:199 (-),score=24.71 gnl/TRDRNA2_/TRDRNA2_166693_c0_seq2:57-572(-)
MMDQDGDKAIDFDEFLNGMVRLIRNSRFQETCMAQRARCQIKRQINEMMETQDIHTAQIRKLVSDISEVKQIHTTQITKLVSDMSEVKQLLLDLSGKHVQTYHMNSTGARPPTTLDEVPNFGVLSDSSRAIQPLQGSAAASGLRRSGTADGVLPPESEPPGFFPPSLYEGA